MIVYSLTSYLNTLYIFTYLCMYRCKHACIYLTKITNTNLDDNSVSVLSHDTNAVMTAGPPVKQVLT